MKIEQFIHNNQDISPDKNLKKAARDFESFFVSYLLKVMRETVPNSGLLNPGVGGEIYTSMMDEHVAENIASKGGLGLSNLIEKQINHYLADTDKMNSRKRGDKA